MKNLLKNFFIVLILFVLISVAFSMLGKPTQTPKELSLTELASQINDEKISQITVNGQELKISFSDGTTGLSQKRNRSQLNRVA